MFRDYGIVAQNLVELGAMAWLVDPVATKERSTTKRKVISLVKVSLFLLTPILILNVKLIYSLLNGTAEWRWRRAMKGLVIGSGILTNDK